MEKRTVTLAKFRNKLISPAIITLAVCLAYLGIVLIQANGDPLDLARIGTRFSESASLGTEGYDGQFILYIASDPNPATVSQHLDVPAYRYQRILLPLLARLISFGQREWLPWVIPGISLTAHILAVILLSGLFEAWGINRWYSLVYGLWVGLLLVLRLDLPEGLAFSLVIAAFWLDQKGRPIWSSLCFGLALFAKETTIFFVVAQGVVLLVNRRWRQLFLLSLLAGLPFVIFRFWLLRVFGSFGFGVGGAGADPVELLPFFGLWRTGEYSWLYFSALVAVYLPSLIIPAIWGLFSSARRWLERYIELPVAALFLNAAIYPFLPRSLYIEPLGTLRLGTGLVLAILLFAARFRLVKVLNFSFFWLFFLFL